VKTGRLTEEEKKLIKEMRKDNKSYAEIAKIINCKSDRVKSYCNKNDLGGFKSREYSNPKKSLDRFKTNLLNKYNGRFNYIAGYKNCDSTVVISCNDCGSQYEKNAQFVRKDKIFRCDGCNKNKKKEELKDKLKDKEVMIKLEQQRKEKQRIKKYTSECIECAESFVGHRVRLRYCSLGCARKRHSRIRDLNRRKKLKENGIIDNSITLSKLISRDKGKCKLCEGRVKVNDYIKTIESHFIAGNNYPSIDHVLPVSKGGTHTWDNVQLAHRVCNAKKNDNITTPIQLKLLGL